MGCADVCVSMDHDGSNEFYSEATRRSTPSQSRWDSPNGSPLFPSLAMASSPRARCADCGHARTLHSDDHERCFGSVECPCAGFVAAPDPVHQEPK